MIHDYNKAYFTIDDIRNAEVKTRGIIGHTDIESLLLSMISEGCVEISWFSLSECERDLIVDWSQIKPREHP